MGVDTRNQALFYIIIIVIIFILYGNYMYENPGAIEAWYCGFTKVSLNGSKAVNDNSVNKWIWYDNT